MNHGALGNPQTDCRHATRLGREHLRHRTAAALAHRHDDLAFARLVLGEPSVDPISGQVLRPDMAAEIGAVDLSRPSLAANTQRLHAGSHGLAQFVRQHERRLVLHIEVTGEGEHALALHLVAKYCNGHQVTLERQLVPGEQGTRSHREIGATRLATPARLIGRAVAIVADLAAAIGTDRLAIGLRPAQAQEHIFCAAIGHPHHLARVQRAGDGRQQKVLGQGSCLDDKNITRTSSRSGPKSTAVVGAT